MSQVIQIGHSKVKVKQGVRPSGIPFIEIWSASNDNDFEWKVMVDAGAESCQAEATLECLEVKTRAARDVGMHGRVAVTSVIVPQ